MPIAGNSASIAERHQSNELDGAFAAMAKEKAGALLVLADPLFILHRARLAALVAKHRLPTLGYRELVEAGALMSYGLELVINVRTARALRLVIPQPLLVRADYVID